MKGNLLRAVRSVLSRPATPPSAHPDPNLLAGFAENTLVAREREEVADHLARCADCREFLVLAFAADVDEPAIAVTKAQIVRRWSPVWSWAASLATVCIVVSAVWEFRGERIPEIEAPPPPAEIAAPQPSAPQELRAAQPKAQIAKSSRLMASPAPPAPAAGTPKNAPGGDGVRANAEASAPMAATPPPPPPPPPALPAPKQETTDAVAAVAMEHANAQAASAGLGLQKAAPSPASAGRSQSLRMKTESRFGGMRQSESRGMVGGSGPRVMWTIAGSPRGLVQRSMDGGATWVTVALSDEISFRAVTSMGPEVWAGGSGGALFHSADSGAHWERVAIGTIGTILEIQALGGGSVSVTTEAHEHWLSQDNGHTWQLTDTLR